MIRNHLFDDGIVKLTLSSTSIEWSHHLWAHHQTDSIVNVYFWWHHQTDSSVNVYSDAIIKL